MRLSAAPGHRSQAGGCRLSQNHKVHRANGNSMMCFKKCLYGTLLDGVQRGEGRLARREAPPPEKAGWTGLITAGLWEHSGRGINHLGSPSPQERGLVKVRGPSHGETEREAPRSFSALPRPPCLHPHWDTPRQVGEDPPPSS